MLTKKRIVIEDDPKTPRLIKTIYRAGYLLAADVR